MKNDIDIIEEKVIDEEKENNILEELNQKIYQLSTLSEHLP